ncbi:MAG: transporter ATP-binding protein [Acidimicrobiaceae bacterium]|nr:transporter ATP-binding protein [Acidimicrobiaceae bacterium]
MSGPPPVTERPLLLQIDDLAVRYRGRRGGEVLALDGVSLGVPEGKTVGLVGESGSGKSTLGRAVLGLAPVARGSISFAGRDITHADRRDRRALSREIQVVFQDPYGSLNPTVTIGRTVAEPLRAQGDLSSADTRRRVAEVLDQVGLPASAAARYPSEFSGGQRQRIAIARAVALRPRLIICDEPVSALDLSIQAQVLNLFNDLKAALGVSYLFISHDLGVVRFLVDEIVVLHRGRVVEAGNGESIFTNPREDYTKRLLAAVSTHGAP